MSETIRSKILLYSTTQFFTKSLGVIHSRMQGEPVLLREAQKILPQVYEHMPALIVAEVGPEDMGALEVLLKIKRDPVLEHIPVMTLSKKRFVHQAFDAADGCLFDNYAEKDLLLQMTMVLLEKNHQLDINPFTGLAGQHTIIHKLENALELGGPFSVCMARIHNLKLFGSQYGAQSSDALYGKIVESIKRVYEHLVQGQWLIGQLSYNDFVIFLPDALAEKVSKEIVDDFERNYGAMVEHATQAQFMSAKDPLSGKYRLASRVSLSVGVMPLKFFLYPSMLDLVHHSGGMHGMVEDAEASVVFVDDRTSGNQKLELAEKNLYPSTVLIRKTEAAQKKEERKLAEYFVREGKVETYFQPIVDFWERQPHAYEALSRFILEDGSFVNPFTVFEAARDADLLVEMDLKCVSSALHAFGEMKTSAKLFLNTNRETFIRLHEYVNMFTSSKVPLPRIVVELTEQSLLSQSDKLMETKHMLQEMGVNIAFDDAGTGAVSFREVGQIKPAYVKFDRELISGITRSPLKQRHVLSMRAFAKGVGAMTIAEGIEMASEFEFLKAIRLNFAQGYYVTKPSKELVDPSVPK